MQTSKTDAQDCIDFKSVLVFSVFNCTVSSYRQGLILHLHLCRNFPNAPWQCAACLFPQQLTTHHNPHNRPHWCLPEQTGPENKWVFVSLSAKTCNLFRNNGELYIRGRVLLRGRHLILSFLAVYYLKIDTPGKHYCNFFHHNSQFAFSP